MVRNQLFKKTPDIDLLNKILDAFSLKSLHDEKVFSKLDIIQNDTLNKMIELKDLFAEYYIPCKARTYLNDLNTKNIMTILRQCIRTYGFKIRSREKYIKGNKYILYRIIPLDPAKKRDMSQCEDNKCVVTFT